MSAIFFRQLATTDPGVNLGIGGGTHGANTGRMLESIELVLLRQRPAIVLVYGDTDSTPAGTLAAVKLHIPVAHVEAGLRSFNGKMPEKINSVLTDHAADLLFAPTQTAAENLLQEGIHDHRIRKVGDVMYDATLCYTERFQTTTGVLKDLGLEDKGYILATVHRAENTDDPARLRAIIAGLGSSSHPVVLPMHPPTRQRIQSFDIQLPPGIRTIEPIGYLEMMALEHHARIIATDSGDVQKEAFFHGVPCVTLRDETEWTELVDAGWNRLAPPVSPGAVEEAISRPFNPGADIAPYGSGDAGIHIVAAISGFVSELTTPQESHQ